MSEQNLGPPQNQRREIRFPQENQPNLEALIESHPEAATIASAMVLLKEKLDPNKYEDLVFAVGKLIQDGYEDTQSPDYGQVESLSRFQGFLRRIRKIFGGSNSMLKPVTDMGSSSQEIKNIIRNSAE